MNGLRNTLVFRKTILSVSESTLAQSGIPISPFCILRTTTKKHGESGQPVCARVVQVRSAFEFVTLKGGTAGSSVAPNRFGRATGLYSIGSGLISTLKTANAPKKNCGGVKRIYLKRRD